MDLPHVSVKNPSIQAMLHPAGDTVVVEGAWAHRRLLAGDAAVLCFAWCPELADDPSSRARAAAVAARASTAWRVSARTAARLSGRRRPSALHSLVRVPRWTREEHGVAGRPLGQDSLLLVADGVRYSGNLGALLRVADACAADAVLLTGRTARLDRSAVFTASRGTLLTMPVLEIPDPVEAMNWLRHNDFQVLLADPSAKLSYRDEPFAERRPVAVVVGSESSGADPAWYRHRHTPVAIPMYGRADSLNVAAAAAVLLCEARVHKGLPGR